MANATATLKTSEFCTGEGGPIVRNHQIRKSMRGKHGPQLGNGVA